MTPIESLPGLGELFQAANEVLQAERAELRKQVAAAKAANEAGPDDHYYDEATTRDLFIDVPL